MCVRKFVSSFAACGVGLMLLTAVASAVPARVPSTSGSNRALRGTVFVKTSTVSMPSLGATSAMLQEKLRSMAPAAEPAALMFFGTALIGAARIARRRTPAGRSAGSAAS